MRVSLRRLKSLNSRSIFCLVVLLTLLFSWQAYNYSRDWSLAELHQHGENRLLAYISGIRRDLKRFKPMPYVLSQSAEVKQLLLEDNAAQEKKVNRFLEQTNQVAGTSHWAVLDTQGQVIASSDWRSTRSEMGKRYAKQPFFLEALAGEEFGGYRSSNEDLSPLYFLSAPIYHQERLIGVAVVSVDLQRLQDNWPASGEHLAVSDRSGVIFLSSLESMRYQRLPDPGAAHAESVTLPYRWRPELLQDDTRIFLLKDRVKDSTGNGYLVQSVQLDDLHWNVHFLSELTPMQRRLRSVLLFSLGGGLAAALLVLFIRERRLKILSLLETRELRLSNEAQQRAVISNTQAGLIVLDAHGRVRFINPRAQTDFGVRQEQILSLPIATLLAAPAAQSQLQNLSAKLSDRFHFKPINLLEGLGVRGDGSHIPLMISINPIAWEGGDGYLATVIDITKRKRAEHALKQANEVLEQRVQTRTRALHDAQAELIQQSKLAALGTLSTAIAHELNQPLTAIRTSAFSTRLLLERGQYPMAEKTLSQIVQMTERMALITQQLKTFAHKRMEKLQPVSVRHTLDQVLPMFAARLSAEQVTLQIAGEPPTEVLADQPRLEQVLINLISNALDAMLDSDRKQLSILLEEESEYASIAIGDTGTGLSEAAREQLFDPFFTTKKIGRGLGLGLSISHGIALDLAGSLSADNQLDGGAIFTLRLPLYTKETITKTKT
ncbi:MAG: two-component system C4-dicarboxylate transport sensor histidine kinase DctB [Motiliproteus sp.]|jgi:two-component system C4-dicarboxylate transport sensor histidine kinase DctB